MRVGWGKSLVAKVIYGKQSEFVFNEVIAMRTAMPYGNPIGWP
jgi:hypothetical protein